jgi:hypothetical protein
MKTIEQEPVREKITITVLPEDEKKLIPGNLIFPLLAGTITGLVLIFSLVWGVEILFRL